MKAILLTMDGCEPCDDLRGRFADLIDSGEVVEKNLERDETEVSEIMAKYDISEIPSLLVISDKGELILSL